MTTLTSWYYRAPIWSGTSGLMKSDGTQSLSQHRVELVQLTRWDGELDGDDGLGCRVSLTLH
jgi:hypothetical protein